MTLASQFCTPSQARILRDLGIDQGNNFFFLGDKGPFEGSAAVPQGASENEMRILEQRVSAFSCAELAAAIPASITVKHRIPTLEIVKVGDHWEVRYNDGWDDHFLETSKFLANALAKMLIHLLNNKLATVEAVNARLKHN